MTEFIQFNWLLFKALGLLSANIVLVCLLLTLLYTMIGNIFGGFWNE